jgi:hypothetical protein
MMAQPTEQKGQIPGVSLALFKRNSLGFIDTPVPQGMHCKKLELSDDSKDYNPGIVG